MIEDGPDAFVQRWRPYAADAVLFARPEGSPLLEVEVDDVVLQLLERTNPYLAVPGTARILVNPTAATLAEADADDAPIGLEVPSRGALAGVGTVLAHEGAIVVLDAGAPIVLASHGALPDAARRVGARLRFEAEPPIHGFVLPPDRRAAGPNDGRSVDEAP